MTVQSTGSVNNSLHYTEHVSVVLKGISRIVTVNNLWRLGTSKQYLAALESVTQNWDFKIVMLWFLSPGDAHMCRRTSL